MPKSLLNKPKAGQEIWTVSRCISEYLHANSAPVFDIKVLHTIRPLLATASSYHLNYDWSDGWGRGTTRLHDLSPSTIRLAQCFDWMPRKHPYIMEQNPLRLLKRGFATCMEE